MPKAPSPITSPPSRAFQPYDATSPGELPCQVDSGTVYDSAGGEGANPWPKVADGGASDASGHASGQWPGDGSSDGSAWKQA